MKSIKIIIITFVSSLLFLGCGENEDGSSKSTYSSCKISSSSALLARDRANDLKQCWNLPGDGYESETDALSWCKAKADLYKSNKYFFEPRITVVIESTYCPK